jgi:hypothetical protein
LKAEQGLRFRPALFERCSGTVCGDRSATICLICYAVAV